MEVRCAAVDRPPIVGVGRRLTLLPRRLGVSPCTPSRANIGERDTGRSRSIERGVAVSTTADIEAPLEREETEKKQFNWFKNWWPVQFTSNLDTDRPNRIQLLGEYFAVWKNKNGEWVAMKDMCPHRLAPLSEGATPGTASYLTMRFLGRVEEDGTLMCSYHGWRFNACGTCVKIPQADDEKSHETACNNPRSAAQTYPCKERGRMLWIWPDDSNSAYLDSASTPMAIPDDIADYLESGKPVVRGFSRLLPYDYEILMENVMDPSHLPFSHHGIMPGMDRSKGSGLSMKPVATNMPLSLASFQYPGLSGYPSHLDRIGACLAMYRVQKPDLSKSPGYSMFFVSPVAEEHSRILSVGLASGVISGHTTRSSPFELIDRWLPALTHTLQNAILDGDNVFLHIQGNRLREKSGQEWTPETYFTPAAADAMVMSFRKWLHTEAGGGPFGPKRAQNRGEVSRRELLDRYHSHTLQCKDCQKALRFFERLAGVVRVLGLGCVAAGGWVMTNALFERAVCKWQGLCLLLVL